MNRNKLLKYLSISALSLSSAYVSYGCPKVCEVNTASSFSMKETVSAYVGPTDTSSGNVSMLTMLASDDLENYLDDSNVTFLHPSSELSSTLTAKEDSLFGARVYEWPEGTESVETKGKRFTLKIDKSDGDVKTLTLNIENTRTGTLLKKYKLVGGYKRKVGDKEFVILDANHSFAACRGELTRRIALWLLNRMDPC